VFWGANKGKWRHLSGLIAHMINKEYLKKLFEYWDSKHVKVALHKLKSDVLTWVIGQDPQITFSDFKKQQTENSSSTEFWLLYQYLEFYSPSE
jgi:hypothetical protein